MPNPTIICACSAKHANLCTRVRLKILNVTGWLHLLGTVSNRTDGTLLEQLNDETTDCCVSVYNAKGCHKHAIEGVHACCLAYEAILKI